MWIPTTQENVVSAGGSNDGWTDDTAATWTYASASTFTVVGDRTEVFSKGTRLRFTQTTVKYGVVAASSHAAGTTTVTIAVNTDYVLANAAISATSYSYAANPQGYPGWFSFADATTGITSPTVNVAKFSVVGTTVFIEYSVAGTSSLTTKTFTLPVSTNGVGGALSYSSGYNKNNGTPGTTPARVVLANSSTTCSLYNNLAAAAWTASGTWQVDSVFAYEF